MKKTTYIALSGLLAVALLCGCSSGKKKGTYVIPDNMPEVCRGINFDEDPDMMDICGVKTKVFRSKGTEEIARPLIQPKGALLARYNNGKRSINSRAYVSRFNFGGNDQQKKAGVLSGGERNRMHLALTLKQEANVLLLDEPTNDIDVNTLRALEEGLENFAGCAVIISHDRWFLDRVATHILAFEGN